MDTPTSNEEFQLDYSYRLLVRDVWKFLLPYRGRFLLGSILRASGDITYLYTAYALAKLIAFFTHYSPGASLHDFWIILILWAVTHSYLTVSRQGAKYLCYQIAERVGVDGQLAGLKHLQSLDIAWHETENTGNKLKRVHNGGEALMRLLRIWVDNLIEIVINLVGMVAVIAFTDGAVAIIVFVFLLTYLCIALPLARRASKVARLVNQLDEDFGGLAFEFLNNIRSVKAMGMFMRLWKILQEQSERLYEALASRAARFRSKAAIQEMWAHLFRIIAMVVIVYGIVHGRYEVGFLILFNFYFTQLRLSVAELAEVSQEITISRYRIARLQDILNETIKIDDETGKGAFPRNWKKISLKNVSFAYGDNEVLKDISFDIKRGERLGIVGLSGAGKSTLFKLLLKEYEDFSGEILFDDASITKIKKSSYFQRVAVVLQETEVFNFSLRDNITIVDESQKDDARSLKRAITTAHVDDFMYKLPNGIDTLIGEKGVKLSGGEKQRLGIARAVYKQPEILFLDEATSHLDLESEEKIRDSLHQFFQTVTAVVIAHRLTTIREMDRILVIEGGSIIEEGSFDELYKKRGRFFDLWEKQKL
ncbi:MAG: ABC transporter ATP-binding protein [Candidatus Magasanikbacteria bacterium]|nr:ABC transporter ATP-binding protein [Candidatus Magasanikbacteria bacterium]